MTTYFPGTRVIVFDSRLYKDDVSTPLSHTMRPATVKQWYGKRCSRPGCGTVDGNLVDVEFDHRPGEVSKGHFADRLEELGRLEVLD